MSILTVDEYQDDPRIKKMNTFRYILPSTWTKNELEEWMKCKLDINYFKDNYFYIMDEYKGGIRVKAKDGSLYFPFTLNNTAIASPRIFIPILEMNQQPDGSVKIPEVLVSYMNGIEYIKPKK